MDNILYIIGAGFSAPLGLPVINNFLRASKDIYQRDPENYAHFTRIFEKIDGMGKAKNYMNCNLFNIEEILSILEMESYLTSADCSEEFTKYIADVVTYYTPPLVPSSKKESHTGSRLIDWEMQSWYQTLFEPTQGNRLLQSYFEFISMLFNLTFRRQEKTATCCSTSSPPFRYGIVSLNYDLVIETITEQINEHFSPEYQLQVDFEPTDDDCYAQDYHLSLAKLHGSLDPLTIVPPTWNKTRKPEIQKSWKLAQQLISKANYIRFLGCSLAPSDHYLRYLLLSGILGSLNLKGIKVVCLGNDKSDVEQNYRSLFNFPGFDFRISDIKEYLQDLACPHSRYTGDEYYSGSMDHVP